VEIAAENTETGLNSERLSYTAKGSAGDYPYSAITGAEGDAYVWLPLGNQLVICKENSAPNQIIKIETIKVPNNGISTEIYFPEIEYRLPVISAPEYRTWTGGAFPVITYYYGDSTGTVTLAAYDYESGFPIGMVTLDIINQPAYTSYTTAPDDLNALTALVRQVDSNYSPAGGSFTMPYVDASSTGNELRVDYILATEETIIVEIWFDGESFSFELSYVIPVDETGSMEAILTPEEAPDFSHLGYELDLNASTMSAALDTANDKIILVYTSSALYTTTIKTVPATTTIIEKNEIGQAKVLMPPYMEGYTAIKYTINGDAAEYNISEMFTGYTVTDDSNTEITFYYELTASEPSTFTTPLRNNINSNTIVAQTPKGLTAYLQAPYIAGYEVAYYALTSSVNNKTAIPAGGVISATTDTDIIFYYKMLPSIGGYVSYTNTGGSNSAPSTKGNSDQVNLDSNIIILPNEAPLGYVGKTLPHEDVYASDWYYDNISSAYFNDLMIGTGSNPMLFSPNMNTTRAMIVTILYNLEGKPAASDLSSFDDVANNIWYTNSIAWAKENDIVSGTSATHFSPNAPITRQDLAFIPTRYAKYSGILLPKLRDVHIFNDYAQIAPYAKSSVDALYTANIINNKADNIFDPKGYATRAEVATLLYQFQMLYLD